MRKYSQVIAEFRATTPKSKDTLEIERLDMPQVHPKDYAELLTYLTSLGIKMEKGEIKAKKLSATQSDFNLGKILSIMGILKKIDKANPLIVSSDNYIVDGHHRWLAARNGGQNISIIKADVKIRVLLRAIKNTVTM